MITWYALLGESALAQGKKREGGQAKRPAPQEQSPGANVLPQAVFNKFSDWAVCAAFSPDAKLLAVGSNRVVKLYDLADLREITTLDEKAGMVNCLAFSPDGKWLATGSYQSLVLWDLEKKQAVWRKKGHQGTITALAISPDQKLLATASNDESTTVWDLTSGEKIRTLPSVNQPVQSVAFSPDGRQLAIATGDADRPTKKGSVCVFDLDGQLLHTFDGHKRIVTSVAFSPDGKLLASGSVDQSIKLWDLAAGKEIRELEGHSRPVNSLLFINGGKYLVSVCGGNAVGGNELKLWEVETGKDLATVPAHESRIQQVAVSADGRRLATVSYDKSAKVFSLPEILAAAGQSAAASTGAAKTAAPEFHPESPALPNPATAFGLTAFTAGAVEDQPATVKQIRIGMIGLDTSHSVAFTQIINTPPKENQEAVAGCRVVFAYPQGSKDIPSSVSRVPEYTEKVKALGVEIIDSIDEMVKQVDAVLLESNDGRPHLEQVLPVLKAGKPVFIDKPIAGSLADAVAIFEAAKKYKAPVFSSSSLRYTVGAQAIRGGKIGEVKGCDAYSPCALESTHPDLFWYGIHGVESLFTVMGPGCESVTRVNTPGIDLVAGAWKGGRVGTFRGIRTSDGGGKADYGGTAFGTNGIEQLGTYGGYAPLVFEIVKFFRTGKPPVAEEETLEIYAFMEAADESKRQGGRPVTLESVLAKARAAAKQGAGQ